jgi:hypothetical protein
VVSSSVLNNDGQTSIDSVEKYKCEKFHQFLPAGPTKLGVRQDPLIQFWCERFIDGRGNDRYGFLRTVSTMSVISILGKEPRPAVKQPVVKARTRAQRLALRGK